MATKKKTPSKPPADTAKPTAANPRRKLTVHRALVTLLLVVVPMAFLPQLWCGREAGAWYRGERSMRMPLARHVMEVVQTGVGVDDFSTGSARFDGEWLFGTYLMSGIGLSQVVLEHPETSEELLPVIRTCIERLLEKRTREFDNNAWGSDPIETLENGRGHAAYLGYFNILLGLHRMIEPNSPHAALNDRITLALVKRLQQSPIGLIESYPLEVYPVDNAACFGGIALHQQVTGTDHRQLLQKAAGDLRTRYTDPTSGMLIQAVGLDDGNAIDKPRGSGTALASYFLSFDDGPCGLLSQEMYSALRLRHSGTILGFGYVREYPASVEAGMGDIDSGPVIFGMSFSGTGFSLGPARTHGDPEGFTRIYRSLYIVGAPFESKRQREFVTGGPLGNAIMLAMLTARRRQPVLPEASP